MAKPIVAIVGRPNVGKSTIFNKLTGQRLAIVEDTPGVTRDRIFCDCEWSGHKFLLVDTGGIEPRIDDGLLAHMREQAQLAIDSADCIVMVTELSAGVTPQDQDVAGMLMRSGKPVVLAVNKCDKVGEPPMELYDFYSLGLGELIPVCTATAPATCWTRSAPTSTLRRTRKTRMTASRLPSLAAPTSANPASSTIFWARTV